MRDATDPLLYHEKIKGSFLRIRKLSADGTAGWEITDTKGTKYKFGTGASTRIQGTVGSLGTQIFKWCLERVEDRDGNYMTMTYTPDQGQGYLSQIDYAGNGATSPTNQVKFYLESRTDAPVMYTSNFAITTAKRLKTIEVRANGNPVRAYQLTYSAGPTTARSLLANMKLHGKDAIVSVDGSITPGTSLPATTFAYSADSSILSDGSAWATAWCNGGTIYSGSDLNGDGKQDVWCRNSSSYPQALISNGTGGFSTWAAYQDTPPWVARDFTGDGKADVIYQKIGGTCCPQPLSLRTLIVAPSTQSGAPSGSAWLPQQQIPVFPPPAGWIYNATGDFNGDGKTDLASLNGSVNGTLLSTGTSFSGAWAFNSWCSGGTMGITDSNGDGRSDLYCKDSSGTISIATSTGSGFTGGGSWISGWCPAGTVSAADFNGDGKEDIYCHPTDGTTKIALSTGSAFMNGGNWITGWCASGAFGTGDFNGDGKEDVYCHPSDGTTQVALSTGAAFIAPSTWRSSWCTTGSYGVGDFTGDGKTDVYCFNAGTVSIAQSGTGQLAPDLLASVSNGIGSTTTVAYTPSPRHSTTSAPAHPQLPYPVQTATSMTTSDGNGNSSTTTYSYTGGYHHIGERDFRGFQKVEVTSPGASDADKTLLTTEFLQGRGVVSSGVTTIAADDPSVTGEASLKGRPYRVTVAKKTDPAYIYTKTETSYHDDRIGTNTTAPYFSPLAQGDTVVCDGAPCKTSRVVVAATDYDAYGNVLRESHHGDLSVVGDEKTVQRTFLANTTDYVVSAPARETMYKGLSVAVADRLAETLFYYDGTGTGACTAAPTGSNTAVTKGKLTKAERWLNGGTNPISGMEYDPTTGVLLCTRDPLGNKTTLTYDPTKTFVLTSTNQLGHVTTTVYSGVNGVAIDPATGFYGTVKSVTDPNGKVVSHGYDALGRKLTTTTPASPTNLTTTVAYPTLAEFGQVGIQKITTTTSGSNLPASLISSVFFDGLGRTFKKESSGPNGATLVTETQYDVKGQVFRTSLPYFKTTESVTGRWRTMSYDALGRVVQVTHPDTLSGTPLTSKSCYAPFITVTLDPSGARKRETKDAYGRVVKIEEYNTTTSTCDTAVGTPYATTNYTYDLLGNLTKVIDALGNRTTMRYDSLSRKLALSDPDMSTNGTSTCGDLTALSPAGTYPWYAAPCWNYQYDAGGNLTRQTDAKSQHLWFRYDGLNRRTQKDYTTQKAAGSGDVRYIYDDTVNTFNRKGRLKQVIDAATNVTFEYDAMGRVSKSTKVLDGTTYVTTSVFDGLGRLKEVTYPTSPAKTVEYLYTGPVLERVRDKSGSGTTTYAIYSNYTSQGQAQTITYGNGVVTTSTFADPAHSTCIPANSFKLCTLKTQKGANPLYQDFTYTFTADGNVDLITDPINGNQDFGYDALDRLTSATGPYGTGGAMDTITYSYNQIGNILSNSQLTGGTFTYPTSGAGVVRPHAVQIAGPYQYSYDNNGNQTGITSTLGDYSSSTTFNVDNRLASAVTTFGTTTINSTFVYDGDGGRVKKIVGTTTTRYISKLYECDTTGANTSCSRFIWAGDTRIATVATNGTLHYWHGDHLGSSSVITDSTGAKVQALTYSPYGGVRTNQSFTTPAVDVPYKYTGKEFDYSTDFYFYGSRYYDPWFGRFISPDTIVPNARDPQDLNRYAYAKNNPMLYTDPSGHFAFIPILIGIVVTAAVSTVTSVAIAAATEGDLIDAAKYGAVSGAITGGLCPVGCGFVGSALAHSAAGAASSAALGQDPGRGAMYGAAMGAALSVVPNPGFQPFGNSSTNWAAKYANQVVNDSLRGAAFGATAAGIQGRDIGQGAWAGALVSAGGRQFNNLLGHGVGLAASGFRTPTYSDGAFAYPCSWCGGAITFGNVITMNTNIHGALFDANVTPNSKYMEFATETFLHELGHVSQYADQGIAFLGGYGVQVPFVALTGQNPFMYNLNEIYGLGNAMTSPHYHKSYEGCTLRGPYELSC